MASVILQGNGLTVRFNDGSSRASGVNINAGMSEADIRGAIGRAKSLVSAYYYGAGDDAHGGEAERASGNASAFYRQLHPEAQPAQTQVQAPPPAVRRETARPQQRREERQPAVRQNPRGSTPRPTITGEWIESQIRDATSDDRRSQAAATAVYANRMFVNQFLSIDPQRGVARTNNQKNVTIAVFNSLYQIPGFRLYLSSLAAMRRNPYPDEVQRLHLASGDTVTMNPEYLALQTFLTEPGRPERLSEQSTAEIIRAADMYTRHFLLMFAAPNQLNARYRQEIGQMNRENDGSDLGWRLRNINNAQTYQPQSGRGASQTDRDSLSRLFIAGVMDADTIVASMLFVRRWTQEHPERGRGRTQDQIALWQIPQVIPLEQVQPEQRVVPPPQQVAPTTQIPRIAIVGDSILAGGRMGTTLRTSLQPAFAGASTETFAHVGDPLSTIRTQLRDRVLNATPPYNTVILQGGINGMAGTPLEESERIFTTMINESRQRGLKVIILLVTPWAGYSGSNDLAQTRTTQLNQWLRNQASGSDVVVVDTSVLGEGNPPRLRQQFNGGDGLHPNDAGRDQIATLVAQSAYGIAQTQVQRRSALQDFADTNWRTLSTELYQNVSGGVPEGIATVIRNKPEGTSSVEDALRTLNRDDIARTFDRVFNDYMKNDHDFLEFCHGRREYQGIERNALSTQTPTPVTLSASTSASERRLIIRAMQDYLNYEAGRSGADWYSRLRDDLRVLYRQVLNINSDNIDTNATEDLRTLAALAVYSWRKNHQADAVGAWGPNLHLRIDQPAQIQQVPPPPPPPPPPDQNRDTQRRRTIPI